MLRRQRVFLFYRQTFAVSGLLLRHSSMPDKGCFPKNKSPDRANPMDCCLAAVRPNLLKVVNPVLGRNCESRLPGKADDRTRLFLFSLSFLYVGKDDPCIKKELTTSLSVSTKSLADFVENLYLVIYLFLGHIIQFFDSLLFPFSFLLFLFVLEKIWDDVRDDPCVNEELTRVFFRTTHFFTDFVESLYCNICFFLSCYKIFRVDLAKIWRHCARKKKKLSTTLEICVILILKSV